MLGVRRQHGEDLAVGEPRHFVCGDGCVAIDAQRRRHRALSDRPGPLSSSIKPELNGLGIQPRRTCPVARSLVQYRNKSAPSAFTVYRHYMMESQHLRFCTLPTTPEDTAFHSFVLTSFSSNHPSDPT